MYMCILVYVYRHACIHAYTRARTVTDTSGRRHRTHGGRHLRGAGGGGAGGREVLLDIRYIISSCDKSVRYRFVWYGTV